MMSEVSPRKASSLVRDSEGGDSARFSVMKVVRDLRPSPSEPSPSAKRGGMGLRTVASPKLHDEYIFEVVAPAEDHMDVKECNRPSIPFKRSLVPVLFDGERSSMPEWVPSHLLRFRASVVQAAVAEREETEKLENEKDQVIQLQDLQLLDNANMLDWHCITEQEELMSSLPQACLSDDRVCCISNEGRAATGAVASRDASRFNGTGLSEAVILVDDILPKTPAAVSMGNKDGVCTVKHIHRLSL
eukprot:gnl/TRDRNA2_/TRDRNA2_166957_c0_seq3.p1 gnl/TRDRNA2_/TRDRNA2_166957_c0~~gnl/TRDRNA2_/TRDRNA2_166957_c0_seq3.p1  ORF type:complete len:255 (-),score=36.75 gnl/TRDRNA2_/TRDRNA2_166957_c0_seq3:253-987(-)